MRAAQSTRCVAQPVSHSATHRQAISRRHQLETRNVVFIRSVYIECSRKLEGSVPITCGFRASARLERNEPSRTTHTNCPTGWAIASCTCAMESAREVWLLVCFHPGLPCAEQESRPRGKAGTRRTTTCRFLPALLLPLQTTAQTGKR